MRPLARNNSAETELEQSSTPRDTRMNHSTRLIIVISAAVAAATSGCRQKEVRPEELFQAQSFGLSYLETGQLPEAEAQFKKVIALAPKEPLGYANLGLTYLRGARYSEAETQLRLRLR